MRRRPSESGRVGSPKGPSGRGIRPAIGRARNVPSAGGWWVSLPLLALLLWGAGSVGSSLAAAGVRQKGAGDEPSDRPAPGDDTRGTKRGKPAEDEVSPGPEDLWGDGVAFIVEGVDRRLGSQWTELRDLSVRVDFDGLGDWLGDAEVTYVWLRSGADAIRIEGELADPGMRPYVQASLKEHVGRWIRWTLRVPLGEELAGARVERSQDEGMDVLRVMAPEGVAAAYRSKMIWIGEDLRPRRASIERKGPDGTPWVETTVFQYERTPPGLRLQSIDCETPVGPLRGRFSWVDRDEFELVSRVEIESAVNPLPPLVLEFRDWKVNQGLTPADLRE